MLNTPIAIVGMDCLLPGAASLERFWENLLNRENSILSLSGSENSGLHAAVGYLDHATRFDYDRFGLSRREASQIDPQHRMFLTCVATALERVQKSDFTEPDFGLGVGVFAGCPMNTYLPNTRARIDVSLHTIEGLQATLHNDKDYLALRTAHILNLRGPAVNIQTSCSSATVGTHLACLALGAGDCGLAVVGGASVMVPQLRPYRFVEGSIFSRDGRCRPFTQNAEGTVHGNGAAAVVLKRLEDAVRDRNSIYGVIISSALNNDGSMKDGFTSPSVDGQCDVIEKALFGIDVDSIGLVETHGTGTRVGDRIELEGLNRVFSAKTMKREFCALGAAKAQIGHLEAASSAISLIKTALCLSRKKIPANLYHKDPMDLGDSPFYFPETTRDWTNRDGRIRRACVSSFGMGGTNAHMVVEEPPAEFTGITEHVPDMKPDLERLPECRIHPRPWTEDPELGVMLKKSSDETVFEIAVNIHSYPWFEDHLIGGSAVVPGTYYIYLMYGAIRKIGDKIPWVLRSIDIRNTLNLSGNKTSIRISCRKNDRGWSIRIESRIPDNWEPMVHAVAEAIPAQEPDPKDDPRLSDLLKGHQEPLDVAEIYTDQDRSGMVHGPMTQKLKHAVKTPRGILGVVADFENHLKKEADRQVCLLDSCLQLFRFAHGENLSRGSNAYLLTQIQQIDIWNLSMRPGQGIWCLADPLATQSENDFLTDFLFFSEHGDVVGRIQAARERKVGFKADSKLSTRDVPDQAGPPEKPALSLESLVEQVTQIIAENLGVDATEIRQSDTLETLGMDSFSILEMTMALQDKLDQTIDPNDVERDATIDAIAEKLLKMLTFGTSEEG